MERHLKKLFTFGTETAKHLFDKQGFLVPMWIGVDKEGSHVPLIIKSMEDKDRAAEAVRAFLSEHDVIRYVSMLECWTYEGKKIPNEILEGKSLKDNPDRREAIVIYAEDNENNSISGRFYILRPEHGKPKLSPLKTEPGKVKAEGRFVGMFDQ